MRCMKLNCILCIKYISQCIKNCFYEIYIMLIFLNFFLKIICLMSIHLVQSQTLFHFISEKLFKKNKMLAKNVYLLPNVYLIILYFNVSFNSMVKLPVSNATLKLLLHFKYSHVSFLSWEISKMSIRFFFFLITATF